MFMISSADFTRPLPRVRLNNGWHRSAKPGRGPPPGNRQGTVKIVSGRSAGRRRAVFMTASGQPHGRLRAVSRGRRHVTWLATGGYGRTWDADGTPRATLTGHDRPVNAV